MPYALFFNARELIDSSDVDRSLSFHLFINLYSNLNIFDQLVEHRNAP